MRQYKVLVPPEIGARIDAAAAAAHLKPATFLRAHLCSHFGVERVPPQGLSGTGSPSLAGTEGPSPGTFRDPGGVGGGVQLGLGEGTEAEDVQEGRKNGKKVIQRKKAPEVNASQEWARPYYTTWVDRFGGKPNVGLLRKKITPLEQADGRDVTIQRWRHFVAGVNPRFFGKWDPFTANLLRFAGAPAVYDDPDWHLSDRDRAELDTLTRGLF